ncbi:hypothetical protein IQ241_00810 [Romeria aff. gracilis LEGE 07310]|uniref:Uncharacterized protein n=1 Tax=Vasconcelosia minhoensis LEGE 07310 TaxID=915328 RepID=A0A8J7A8E6_9CYAN|nr:hypothetical protein [Romeria gracilis]MBE9075851.1 hypothetical protein [Romeria aff. gracilis LEGE 07310]
MKKRSPLYSALNAWLGQACLWAHKPHLTTCVWMVSALLCIGADNLTRWLPYLPCRDRVSLDRTSSL